MLNTAWDKKTAINHVWDIIRTCNETEKNLEYNDNKLQGKNNLEYHESKPAGGKQLRKLRQKSSQAENSLGYHDNKQA